MHAAQNWRQRVDPYLEEVLPQFENTLSIQTGRLQRLLDCGAVEELQRVGHTFKGSAGYFHLSELTEIARALENACMSGDLVAAEHTIHAWKELVEVLGLKSKQ